MRKAKASTRLKEREKVTGSIELAESDRVTAIRNLAASDFHCSGLYHDWLDHPFKSQEIFEKRLNWTAPVDAKTKGKLTDPSWKSGLEQFCVEEGVEPNDQAGNGKILRAV